MMVRKWLKILLILTVFFSTPIFGDNKKDIVRFPSGPLSKEQKQSVVESLIAHDRKVKSEVISANGLVSQFSPSVKAINGRYTAYFFFQNDLPYTINYGGSDYYAPIGGQVLKDYKQSIFEDYLGLGVSDVVSPKLFVVKKEYIAIRAKVTLEDLQKISDDIRILKIRHAGNFDSGVMRHAINSE